MAKRIAYAVVYVASALLLLAAAADAAFGDWVAFGPSLFLAAFGFAFGHIVLRD